MGKGWSVVVPLYHSAGDLPRVMERLLRYDQQRPGLHAVFVVDGPVDDASEALDALLPSAPFASTVIEHSRNFGSFEAIRSGLAASRTARVVWMSADLQEPEPLVLQLVDAVDGRTPVAVGRREGREDPWVVRLMSALYWRLRRSIISASPEDGADVFACTAPVARQLVGMQEKNSSLIGYLFWLGYPTALIPYRRVERASGRSGWSFRRRVRYAMDGIFAFSPLPIGILIGLGVLGVVGSAIATAGIVWSRFAGRIPVPGYTAIIVAILASTSLIVTAIGIVGSYVWRTYDNTKQRPPAVIGGQRSFGGAPRTDEMKSS